MPLAGRLFPVKRGGGEAVIIAPGQYLWPLSKDDLKIVQKALKQWKGPYPDGRGYQTPIQVEYQEQETKRAQELEREIGEALRR